MDIKNIIPKDLTLNNLRVKYRVLSVSHLPELEEKIDKLKSEGKITQNEVIQQYIGNFKFEVPEDFPEAKSIIILAQENKLVLINFNHNGIQQEVMIPPNYSQTCVTKDEMKDFVLTEIIKEPGYQVYQTRKLHMKLLAANSGLVKYGRNNISYADELGSLIELWVYFTDYVFPMDNWEEVEMMENCEDCTICFDSCPTQAISQDNFILNVERCIPLYNEIQGEIPDWIPTDAHNALMGCMKCQMYCPANRLAINNTRRYEDLTQEETIALLKGEGEETILNSAIAKLKMFKPEHAYYFLPIIKRNLALLQK
ncbi:MAG TPA: 4Fe-4S double cluster binding domain-containing protein [Candidatus Bathyarchaeia archaeon]|nr:4Fe-4S double cluster binding domain-containing protein [Candidatus Bathyarchaeia archaeon]